MPGVPLNPFWTTSDDRTVRLYQGDVVAVLSKLPAKSVQCAVTSPPYWGLRDYGTGTWEGGDAECDHSRENADKGAQQSTLEGGKATNNHQREPWPNGVCGKCGARRIDQQLGSEPSPDCGTNGQAQCGRCFVCAMVRVFREVRRVLRDDGTLWLNLGDSYGGGSGGKSDFSSSTLKMDGRPEESRLRTLNLNAKELNRPQPSHTVKSSLPSGNLVGVPWRVALALQADGWVLRSDVPWVKRASMPESVRNRPAKALEYVFMLVKRSGYYFDMEAVRKPSGEWNSANASFTKPRAKLAFMDDHQRDLRSRNFRNADLWFESIDEPHGLTGVDDDLVGIDITSEAYAGAHFATFGRRLITPFILASTSERGACAKCGAPWVREVERNDKRHWTERNDYTGGKYPLQTNPSGRNDGRADFKKPELATTGWRPSCECCGRLVKRRVVAGEHTNPETGEKRKVLKTVVRYVPRLPLDRHPIRPCVVLDPFVGSGTTCCVALAHGRHSIGIDLSEEYLRDNAVVRIEGELLSRPRLVALAGKEAEVVSVGRTI